MLHNIHVKNLALIDEIEVEFKPGLNILTGETGAGKSILLGSLDLALGGKYHADLLRTGAQYGLVELTFVVEDTALTSKLKELNIEVEEGFVTLSRRLMDGRSLSKINGETVTKSILGQVAELLIDVHAQHAHQTLLVKKNHLNMLDLFAGEQIHKYKHKVINSYQAYKQAKADLDAFDLDEVERKKELSFLEYEINEITEASPKLGEDDELELSYKTMNQSQSILEAVSNAYGYTSGDRMEGASDLISRAIQELSGIEHIHNNANSLYTQLVEIDQLLNDFNRELSDFEKSLEFSEEEFVRVESRLNEINHLKMKYGNHIEEILTALDEKEKRVEELINYEQLVKQKRDALESITTQLTTDSNALSEVRQRIAKTFVKDVKAALSEMNFLSVKLEMRFTTLSNFTCNGIDECEFYISTNPGEPLKQLSHVASGGELSRVMLAIKSVLADQEETPTLVFDEIDAGISGITAAKVAEKMKYISKNRQVICITHLPQIAARADHHYLIEKSASKNKTTTSIVELQENTSIEELARLLGGDKITENTRVSARELKELS